MEAFLLDLGLGLGLGNHVHTILKVPGIHAQLVITMSDVMRHAFQPSNVEALCSCVLTTAQDTPVMADAQELSIHQVLNHTATVLKMSSSI